MRFLKDIVIFIWLSTLFAPLLAGPIEKDAFTEVSIYIFADQFASII